MWLWTQQFELRQRFNSNHFRGRNSSPVPEKESSGISTMLQMKEGWLRSRSSNLLTQGTVLWFTQRRILTYRSITHAENLYWVYCWVLVLWEKMIGTWDGEKKDLREWGRDANSKAEDTWRVRGRKTGNKKQNRWGEDAQTGRGPGWGPGCLDPHWEVSWAFTLPKDSHHPSSGQNGLIEYV